MSSQSEKDLSCPVCRDIFTDPVVLSCSHSFCTDCLKNWWKEKQINECPLCKDWPLMSDPPRNLALRNLCEAFVQERASAALCTLHAEKLKLFCLDHQQPACVICLHSETHNGHQFSPIDEAARDHKQKLQKALEPFKEKLEAFQRARGNFDQTAKHIKVQARCTEQQIKEQFEKLHQFLQEEEEARISALREEEELKSKLMREKIEVLSDEIAALSETIKTTEEELKTGDVSFLQSYKAAKKRVQQRPLLEDLKLLSGALIDVAKHLGNLRFSIWNKMKGMVSYTPVILDPNSAHPELRLSEDLTSLRRGERQKLPENPERIEKHLLVLGSRSFNSGSHTWDVEVRNSESWTLGVVQAAAQRKEEILTGFWRIALRGGKYTAVSPTVTNTALSVERRPERIRVHLHFEKGKLSFHDLDTRAHIHIFTHTFTDRLFPYIGTIINLPLKILPATVEKA